MRKRVYRTPIIPFLELLGEWKTNKTAEEDPLFSFTNHDVQEGTKRQLPQKYKDAFSVMEDFFAIQTPADAYSFFKANGPMQLSSDGMNKLRRIAPPVRFSAVVERQNFWLAFSRGQVVHRNDQSPEMKRRSFLEDLYANQPLQAELEVVPHIPDDPKSELPQFTIRCLDVEEVMRTTVWIERLNGIEWDRCDWDKCGSPFRREGQKNKIFCSPKCAGRQTSKNWSSKNPGKRVERTTGNKAQRRQRSNDL